MLWLYPGSWHRLSSVAHPQDQGQDIHLGHVRRVRAKLDDSKHHWQAAKHHKGKGEVVEILQQKIILLTVLRSACQVNRQ